MGLGPVPSTKKCLERAGLSLKDIDVIEINEAFAAQVLGCLKQLGIAYDDSRVNPNGGAIAVGHPLGASGARLTMTAIRQLLRQGGRYALITACIGVGQGIASVIERALSSPDMKISIGAVDGALSSDATIRDVVLADREGVWLRLDRARLIWSRSSLLLGRLIVDRLEIGHLDLLRKPLPSNQPAAESAPAQEASASGGSQSLLPSLPVQVVVGAFSLADLSLGEDILGVAARLSGKGRASLGRPSDGLDLAVELQRLDAPGALHLGLAFEPATNALKLAAAAHEPAGGLIVQNPFASAFFTKPL